MDDAKSDESNHSMAEVTDGQVVRTGVSIT